MTFLEAKTNLCQTKLNITYSDISSGENQLFEITDIDDAVNFGIAKVVDYKLWPFTEASFNHTAESPTPSGSFAYAAGFEAESAFLLMVGTEPWLGYGKGKRNFPDYMKWFSQYPSDASKIWSEYGGTIYYNANAVSGGATIKVFGKQVQTAPFVTPTDDAEELPVNLENQSDMTSANEAIILLAYAYLLSSEKKKNPAQAAQEEKRAYLILDTLWQAIAERKAQLSPQNRPLFNNGDLFNSGRPSTPTDTTVGNFP